MMSPLLLRVDTIVPLYSHSSQYLGELRILMNVYKCVVEHLC